MPWRMRGRPRAQVGIVAQTAAQAVINAAHIGTYKLSTSDETKLTHETEYISG